MKVKNQIDDTSSGSKGTSRVLRGRVVKYAAGGSPKENIPPKKKAGGARNGRKKAVVSTSSASDKNTLSRKDFKDLVELARGGFAVVYRAFMPSRQIQCVLKFLHHAKLKKMNVKLDDVALERSLLQHMDHVNIPKLIGFYQTPTCSVFVLEYCKRGDIYDYIHRSAGIRCFPRTHFRNQSYIRQLVTAVDYFQKSTKYIHMDVKPENVLVCSNDVIKLTDFGCCIPMVSPRHIHSEHKGGTKTYRPPELIRPNNRQFDSTADVWGIGCVAFQMTASKGEHPFFPRNPLTGVLQVSVPAALEAMNSFKNGTCTVASFDQMPDTLKTFLRQTIGADREQRPLVSRLLETAYLTNTARVFSP